VRQAVERPWARSTPRAAGEVYAAYAEPDADFDALAPSRASWRPSSPPPAPTASTSWRCRRRAAPAALGRVDRQAVGRRKAPRALCKLLLSKPDMLLLDEPTNHLDAESWMAGKFLQRFPGTVVAITHDRYFLDNAAEWILELDRGHGIPWKGNYSTWLEQKEERLEQEKPKTRA
jgi:sulfate-transporting ATPase